MQNPTSSVDGSTEVLSTEGCNQEEADLLDVLILFARHKGLISAITVAGAVLSIILVLLLPSTYTATATILPPQQSQSVLTSMLGQIGALAGMSSKDFGLKNPSDLYIGMLRSRTVEDAIIDRFDLRSVYYLARYQDTRKKLERRTEILADKTGSISIAVEDRDPRRAAEVANAYVSELHRLSQGLAMTEAGQRRIFFERQLDAARQALSDAEIGLKRTQEKTGLIQVDAQGRAIIERVATVRAQIGMREVQLQAMRSFATDRNPDVIRTERELEALKAQLEKMEKDSISGDGNTQVPTGRIPEAALAYVRSLRELKYREAVFEFLSKQLEAARIDEAKDSVSVQIVDKAIPAERRSGPPRLLIVIGTMSLSLLGSLGLVLLVEILKRKYEDPYYKERVQLLRNQLFAPSSLR